MLIISVATMKAIDGSESKKQQKTNKHRQKGARRTEAIVKG